MNGTCLGLTIFDVRPFVYMYMYMHVVQSCTDFPDPVQRTGAPEEQRPHPSTEVSVWVGLFTIRCGQPLCGRGSLLVRSQSGCLSKPFQLKP